jgi:hypothetical protein
MSSLNPLFQDFSFDPEEVTAVNQAYDLACQIQNIGQLEVDRESPMRSAGSTATPERHRADDDMTELTRSDLDSHGWAARASEALAQAKKSPPGLKRRHS